jgi:hypothetical protein
MINKMLALAIMTLVIAGCSYQGDTKNYDNSQVTDNTDNSIDYGNGTPLICTDSNCSIVGGDNPTAADFEEADAIVGQFDADYGPVACRAAGFFYCDLNKVCVNTSRSSGSCTQ